MKHNYIKKTRVLLSLLALSSTTFAMTPKVNEGNHIYYEIPDAPSLDQMQGFEFDYDDNLNNKEERHQAVPFTEMVDAHLKNAGTLHPSLHAVYKLLSKNAKGVSLLDQLSQDVLTTTSNNEKVYTSQLLYKMKSFIEIFVFYVENHDKDPASLTHPNGIPQNIYWSLSLYKYLFLFNNEYLELNSSDQPIELIYNNHVTAIKLADCSYNNLAEPLWQNIIFPNISTDIRNALIKILKTPHPLLSNTADLIFFNHLEAFSYKGNTNNEVLSFNVHLALQESIDYAVKKYPNLTTSEKSALKAKVTSHFQPKIKSFFEQKIIEHFQEGLELKLPESITFSDFYDGKLTHYDSLYVRIFYCRALVRWTPLESVLKKNVRQRGITAYNKLTFNYAPASASIETESFVNLCQFSKDAFNDLHITIDEHVKNSVNQQNKNQQKVSAEPALTDEQLFAVFESDKKKDKKAKNKSKNKKITNQPKVATTPAPVQTSPTTLTFAGSAFQTLSKANEGAISTTTVTEFNNPPIVGPVFEIITEVAEPQYPSAKNTNPKKKKGKSKVEQTPVVAVEQTPVVAEASQIIPAATPVAAIPAPEKETNVVSIMPQVVATQPIQIEKQTNEETISKAPAPKPEKKVKFSEKQPEVIRLNQQPENINDASSKLKAVVWPQQSNKPKNPPYQHQLIPLEELRVKPTNQNNKQVTLLKRPEKSPVSLNNMTAEKLDEKLNEGIAQARVDILKQVQEVKTEIEKTVEEKLQRLHLKNEPSNVALINSPESTDTEINQDIDMPFQDMQVTEQVMSQVTQYPPHTYILPVQHIYVPVPTYAYPPAYPYPQGNAYSQQQFQDSNENICVYNSIGVHTFIIQHQEQIQDHNGNVVIRQVLECQDCRLLKQLFRRPQF